MAAVQLREAYYYEVRGNDLVVLVSIWRGDDRDRPGMELVKATEVKVRLTGGKMGSAALQAAIDSIPFETRLRTNNERVIDKVNPQLLSLVT